jgi:mannose-6-phosphate isomerase-like protein (cupin superfamily)
MEGAQMFCKTFSEGEHFRCAGNEYLMLLPRDITDCCEVVLEKVAAGRRTPPNAHPTFNQIYVVLSGDAEVTIGDKTCRVSAPAVAYIPRNTNHYVVNMGTGEFQYLYVTVWPQGIPAKEKDGGWRHAYTDIIQEYVDRGYSVDEGCR